ncbi:hypothetical protein HUR95_15775 [Caldalkalibacillus thermarum TA2.A1]|uniref:Uncharacterized protein n=1 Tax=Caldalkalibacillus thermarum (strain TA2.A1) TaxID=986075 RepID=A0A8X8I8R4_CALTT|nr:hypothetical protein [Caldalkalibacillus thermarum]QZT33664.1 hypothetical protein HUR95_15775 [Caldalkalibacillus thermarum TA2.A1]
MKEGQKTVNLVKGFKCAGEIVTGLLAILFFVSLFVSIFGGLGYIGWKFFGLVAAQIWPTDPILAVITIAGFVVSFLFLLWLMFCAP